MPLAFLRRPDPDHLEVHHEGALLRVALRRREAARRITLRVSAATGEAVITLPPRLAVSTAQRFAASHAGWIATRLARVPERVAFEPGAEIPIRGEPHRLVLRGARSGPARLSAEEGDRTLSLACDEAHFPRRVRDALMRAARDDITEAVERHAPRLGRRPVRITLRDTRSRWGSCTSRGELNFSWRLILAPPMVLDYLVAHEMAHLREMNHSPRFWAVARDLCGHVDAAEAWLKRNGTELHRFG
ncbi:M48 family metallopeptidase [Methylobacterium sp. J-076]|uniref:M48 family metallopeptidase n=1 Tax=Methylobacterium sp. J-076 TaxID=2836655 RepID=UPI001FBAFD08|nr:SprT family zinc-dependent metalloprotease [Methylobacterium sp. J-076]MCJ2014446.1 M48 family metallopeptidase [Methylobacterium sp. J-076]